MQLQNNRKIFLFQVDLYYNLDYICMQEVIKMLKVKREKVRELIGKTGLSVRAWGLANGFAQPTLSSWLNGTRNIKKQQLAKLADALCVDDLSEISFVEFHLDESRARNLDSEIEEITGLWPRLTDDQRSAVMQTVRAMANVRSGEGK